MDNQKTMRVILELPLPDHKRLSETASKARRSIKAQAEWLVIRGLDAISPKDNKMCNSNDMALQKEEKELDNNGN